MKLKNPKKLTRQQKIFASKEGLNPKELLMAKVDCYNYTFYNVNTGKLITVRR